MSYFEIATMDGVIIYGPWTECERQYTNGCVHQITALTDFTGMRISWHEQGCPVEGTALCVEDNGDHLIWEDDDESGHGPHGGRLFALKRRPGREIFAHTTTGESR